MITQISRSDHELSTDDLSDSLAFQKLLNQNSSKTTYISHQHILSLQGEQQRAIIQILQDAPSPIIITQAQQAPVYICVHWFGGSEKSFDLLKQCFWSSGHLAVFYTISLKGHWGRKEKDNLIFALDQRTPQEIIQHSKQKLSYILDQKKIDQCTLIGHSIGWVVATALANDPDLAPHIDHVVCINPAYYKPELPVYGILSRIDKYATKKTKQTQQLARICTRLIGQKKLDKLGKVLVYYIVKKRLHTCYGNKKSPNIDYFFEDYYTQASNPNFLKAFYYIAINFIRGDMSRIDQLIQSIDKPVHVLHGEKDARFKREKIEEICNKMNNGVFEMMEGLGHNPHEEQPELVVAKIMAMERMIETSDVC